MIQYLGRHTRGKYLYLLGSSRCRFVIALWRTQDVSFDILVLIVALSSAPIIFANFTGSTTHTFSQFLWSWSRSRYLSFSSLLFWFGYGKQGSKWIPGCRSRSAIKFSRKAFSINCRRSCKMHQNKYKSRIVFLNWNYCASTN